MGALRKHPGYDVEANRFQQLNRSFIYLAGIYLDGSVLIFGTPEISAER